MDYDASVAANAPVGTRARCFPFYQNGNEDSVESYRPRFDRCEIGLLWKEDSSLDRSIRRVNANDGSSARPHEVRRRTLFE